MVTIFFQQLEGSELLYFYAIWNKELYCIFSILYSALRPGENNDFSTANEKFKDTTKFVISQIAWRATLKI